MINHNNGYVVKIEGFNRLMLQMMPVFNIRAIDHVVTDKAKTLTNSYIDNLLELAKQIEENGTKEEKKSLVQVNQTFTEQDWWHWEIKVTQADTDEKRVEIYKEGLRHIPKSPELNYNYGWTLMDFFPDKAMPYIKKAIKYNPSLTVVWYSIGLLYQRKKQYKNAILYFKQATEIFSSFSEAWNQLAFCYHDLGDFTKAIEAYKALLVHEPQKALAWNNLGYTFKALSDTTKAISCFQNALKFNPDMAEPLFNIGNIYYNKGQNKKAIAYYK